MKVHHLNCGTLRPRWAPEDLVCHVLLVETDTGLVLVDSGLGLRDIADPAKRFGPGRFYVRPAFDEAETAIRQVQRLGHDPCDVRDIVLTHFDADHAGGLADFPWANVHLSTEEAQAVAQPRKRIEKDRYLPALCAHGPKLVPHALRYAGTWRAFNNAKALTEIAPGIVMVALPGHTRGHAAIAVDTGGHWLLHLGDTFYHRHQVDGGGRAAPFALRAMERLVAYDRALVQANHGRISALWRDCPEDVTLFNTHDAELLRRAVASSTAHV